MRGLRLARRFLLRIVRAYFLNCLRTEYDALLVGNGPPVERSLWLALVERSERLIALDGGLNTLRKFRFLPTDVVGDLDSASPSALKWAKEKRVRIHPRLSTDEPDFAKGLAFCGEAGLRNLLVVGVIGDRLDHSLSAFHFALKARRGEIVFVTSRVMAFALRGRVDRRVRVPQGHALSWFGMPKARACSLWGVRWPFQGRTLRADGFHSLSNEPVNDEVRLAQLSGKSIFVISLRPESRAGRLDLSAR